MAKKIDKLKAMYQTVSTRHGQHCNICTMFRVTDKGNYKCTLVKGNIDPTGWCRYWERKKEPAP